MNINDYDKYDTAVDPCPECGEVPRGYESRPEYVRSNPTALLTIPNPNCPHETDPEADCICTVIPNPAPDLNQDQMVPVANWIAFTPCGHRFEQTQLDETGWRITRTVKPGWHARQIQRLRDDAAALGVELDSA